MNEMERRSLPHAAGRLEIRTRAGESPKLVGRAAVFGKLSQDLGGFKEQINRGAFSEAIQRSDVVGLFNHSPDNVLGRMNAGTLRLHESDKGLEFEMDLPDTQVARDVAANVKAGNVSGNSFSFLIAEGGDEWDHSGKVPIRTITANGIAELRDVGPCTYPAYLDTTISARSIAQAKRFLTSRRHRPRYDRALEWLELVEEEDYEAECKRLGITS